MLADLKLPPGCRIQIDYDPDELPPNVTITVYRDGTWLGEVSAGALRLSQPGELQKSVDFVTRRGVRAQRELPKEGEKVSPAFLAESWRLVKCVGGPFDGRMVGLKGQAIEWSDTALIHTQKGDTYHDPPPGGIYVLDDGGMNLLWIGKEE